MRAIVFLLVALLAPNGAAAAQDNTADCNTLALAQAFTVVALHAQGELARGGVEVAVDAAIAELAALREQCGARALRWSGDGTRSIYVPSVRLPDGRYEARVESDYDVVVTAGSTRLGRCEVANRGRILWLIPTWAQGGGVLTADNCEMSLTIDARGPFTVELARVDD